MLYNTQFARRGSQHQRVDPRRHGMVFRKSLCNRQLRAVLNAIESHCLDLASVIKAAALGSGGLERRSQHLSLLE